MTTWQARRLKPGDAVVWKPDGTTGVVAWTGGGRCCVRWEDGYPTTVSLWHDGADYWHHVGGAVDAAGPAATPAEERRESFRARIRSAAGG
jgi:hypothetical protein